MSTASTIDVTEHCGDNVICDIDSATGVVVRTYITPMLDANVSMTVHGATNETYYYNQDERSSVVNLTDPTGVVAADYAYSAYGDKVDALTEGDVEQRYTYTGRELSEASGYYYFRYRWYGTTSGSFMTRDPLGYVDGLSMYAGWFSGHVGTDPRGLLTQSQKNQLQTDCRKKRKAIFADLKKFPAIIGVIDEIKKLTQRDGKTPCPVPVENDISCVCCSLNGSYNHPMSAKFRPGIWLCYNNLERVTGSFTLKQAVLVRTLHHELIHWRNNCGMKYEYPRKISFEFNAKDEAKAYWESGACKNARDKAACLREKIQISMHARWNPQLYYPENDKKLKKIVADYIESQAKGKKR